ncbi:hypothetical protein OROMI_004598 [Orobanche minor]
MAVLHAPLWRPRMESIKKITDIRNDDRPWVKTVTIVEKFMPYQSTTSTTKLHKFILEDDGGCKVQGIMFNRAYHAMSSKLQLHKTYRISNADVKEIDRIYYARSFFDCNICLDLSKDPVVTCCGHLICWPCLYRWLHIHFDAKECQVCKGEVTTKNLTPIYGRGKEAGNLEDDLSLKIPLRPQARRIESFRQVIQRPTQFSMDEMIRLLNGRFDISQGPAPLAPMLMLHKSPLTESLLCPVTGLPYSNQLVDCAGSRIITRHLRCPTSSYQLDRDQLNSSQPANISHLTSALSSAERLVELYFHNHPVERTQEQPVPVDDRDSISSIAAVIHSESQTVDTAVESDSTVSHSTSSSRRRHEASRVSDVDSGDSRAPRMRRLA